MRRTRRSGRKRAPWAMVGLAPVRAATVLNGATGFQPARFERRSVRVVLRDAARTLGCFG